MLPKKLDIAMYAWNQRNCLVIQQSIVTQTIRLAYGASGSNPDVSNWKQPAAVRRLNRFHDRLETQESLAYWPHQ